LQERSPDRDAVVVLLRVLREFPNLPVYNLVTTVCLHKRGAQVMPSQSADTGQEKKPARYPLLSTVLSGYEPLIEAIMVGFSEGNSISFTSPGRALIKRKE